jgi:hypothetical protein
MTHSIVECAAIGTDHAENIIPLLLFTGHYLATAVVYLLISRTLPSKGSTPKYHNLKTKYGYAGMI